MTWDFIFVIDVLKELYGVPLFKLFEYLKHVMLTQFFIPWDIKNVESKLSPELNSPSDKILQHFSKYLISWPKNDTEMRV